ncbi:methylated-DNA-[protein]-cysteine S-methyltransferase [Bacteroidales bacterium WCE2004]|nr:methylated-DNA-[protein]-cysteine S-methyltransferase [Bacteroidales bacterium WCE2004]
MYVWHYESPLGGMTLGSDGTSLAGLWFDEQERYANPLPVGCEEKMLPVFADTCRWLDIYFSGREPGFTPRLALHAAPFRTAVWEILLTIPYGKTMTYGEIAKRVAERMGAARMSAQAVGGAVGHNPISLIVPCHRVVGAGGALTGYAGGLDRKASLLRLEGVMRWFFAMNED